MPKPLRARLLRYALYFCAALLCSLLILLWQAPALTQRHLPAWLAKHYGLHLSLGEIDIGLRHPSLAIGPPPCSMTSSSPSSPSIACSSPP